MVKYGFDLFGANDAEGPTSKESMSILDAKDKAAKDEKKANKTFEERKTASHKDVQDLNMKAISDYQKMVVDSDKRKEESKAKSNFLEEVPYERQPDFVDTTESGTEEEAAKGEMPAFPKNLGLYQDRMVFGRYYGDPKTGRVTRLTSKPRDDGKFDVAAEWLTKKVGTDNVSGHGSIPLYKHISDVDPFAEDSTYVPLTQDQAMSLPIGVEDAGITPLGKKLIGGRGDKKLFSLDNLLLDNTGGDLEWADDIGDDARAVSGSRFEDELGQRSFIDAPKSDIYGPHMSDADIVDAAQNVGAKKKHIFPETEYQRKANAGTLGSDWYLSLLAGTGARTRKGKPGDRRAQNEAGASPIKMMSNLGGKKFYDLLARQDSGGNDEIIDWLKGSGYDITDPAQKDQIIEFFNNLAENSRSMARQRFESDTIPNAVHKTLQAFDNAKEAEEGLQKPATDLAAAKAAVDKSLQFDTSEHEKKIRDIAARIAVSNIIDSVPGAREKMDPADIEKMIQLMADNKMERQFITAGEKMPGLAKELNKADPKLFADPQRGWGFMDYYDKYRGLFETPERKAQVEQELADLVKQGQLSTEPRDSNEYNNAYSERMSALTGAPGRTRGITEPSAHGRSTMDHIIDYLGGNLDSEWTPTVQDILGRYAKDSEGKVVSDRQKEINELRELIKFVKDKGTRLQNKRNTLNEALAKDHEARERYHNLEGTGAKDLAQAAKKRLARRLRRKASGGLDMPGRVYSNDDISRSRPIAEMIADRMQ